MESDEEASREPYESEHQYVLDLLDEGPDLVTETLEAAQRQLEDPDLPYYYRIRTFIIIASVEDDWDTRERCQREAERLYRIAANALAMQDEPHVRDVRDLWELWRDLNELATNMEEWAEAEDRELEEGEESGDSVSGIQNNANLHIERQKRRSFNTPTLQLQTLFTGHIREI